MQGLQGVAANKTPVVTLVERDGEACSQVMEHGHWQEYQEHS